MSGRTEIERTLDGFLSEGPETVNDQALMRALDAVDRTQQRRGLLAPWRFPRMNTYSRLAAAAVVAAIAVGGTLYLLGPRGGVGPVVPTATPTIATPVPTAQIDPTTWIPFTNSRYGYSLADPIGWQTSPATEDWAGQTSYAMWVTDPTYAQWADKTHGGGGSGITMTALAATLPGDKSEDAFIDAYLAPPSGPAPSCFAIARDETPIVIDGHPARRTTNCGDGTAAAAMTAFVAVGNRMFVFAVSDANQLDWFNAFLSTVRLPAS